MAKPQQPAAYDRDTMRVYWQAMLRHRQDLVLSLLTPVGAVFMSVLVPFFAGRVLASLAGHQVAQAQRYILWLAIVAAIGILLNRVGFVSIMTLMAKCMSDLHEQVFTKLLERSTGFHANQVSGKLVSDALDFVSSFNVMMTAILNNGLPFLFIILSGLIIVAINSWELGLYLLIVVLVTLTWAYFDSRTRFELRVNRLAATKRLTAHLADSIVNAPTVKTFAREAHEIKHNRRLNLILRDLRLIDWKKAGRSGNDRVAALLAMQLILLVVVSRLESTGVNVLATGIFAFTYIFTITTRLFEINNMTRQIEESFLQASPMTRILLQPLEVTDKPDAADLQVDQGLIQLRDVKFHYSDTASQQAVFQSLSLHIAPGERIGLVGPSGGGKSTLTRLLLRFEDLDSGAITVDGTDIADVTQSSLRAAIAYVPQEPLLFHRTIRENIAYGHMQATDADIVEAAHKAFADEFIRSLPQGYQTVVGERGVKLSGGQRQRVAIARAMLKNAPILVLDEATSALDSESEVMIQKALWELMKDRTAIVVAHRLSTIQRMDRIIVLDNGTITEQGTHQQLLARDGLYARLWHHQSGGFIEE